MKNYKINNKYVINMWFGDISDDGHGKFDVFTILSKVDRDCISNAYTEIINKYELKSIFYEYCDCNIYLEDYLYYKDTFNIDIFELSEKDFTEKVYISTDDFEKFIVFLINKEHPDYEVEIIELPECSKYIGYGLFYE